MQITCDKRGDVLSIEFNRVPTVVTWRAHDIVNVDMSTDGKIAAIEVLMASQVVDDVEAVAEQYDINEVLAGKKHEPGSPSDALLITYDQGADAMYIRFNHRKNDNTLIPKVPVIFDLDSDGLPTGIEILQVKRFIGHVAYLLTHYNISRLRRM